MPLANRRPTNARIDETSSSVHGSAGALAATRANAQAPRALRAIYPTRSTSSWAFYIAKEAGIYTKHGLDVKLDFGVHPVGLAGLVSGEVQFTNYSVDDTAAAALRDEPSMPAQPMRDEVCMCPSTKPGMT